jgi:two-component system, sensor histidine kinase RegB
LPLATERAPVVARVTASREDRGVIDPRPDPAVELTGTQAQDTRAAVSLPWLTRLRWGGVAGQLVTVGVGHWTLGLELQLAPVLALIGVAVATNLALGRWLRAGGSAGPPLCGAVLVLDTLLLTGLLHASGGPFNPFSVLYLVYIMLAAVVLGAAWTWSLAGLSVACYVSLFLLPARGSVPHFHDEGTLSLHLWGMLVAFTVAAVLTAYFVVRLSAAIERRDAEIAAMREQDTSTERLAALTTLAAGAAHELGTPLGTIAIAAKELERALDGRDRADGAALREDARLIRAEVERCRRILEQMASDAGETTGEAPVEVPVARLVRDVLDALPPEDAARVRVEGLPLAAAAALPRRAVVGAVASLVRNALDATPPPGPVRLRVACDERTLGVMVEDDGPGMTAEVLARAVEPFFSTKPPGKGMGLGLFLARTLAEGLGGQLTIRSEPGAGATARLDLPRGRLAGASRVA